MNREISLTGDWLRYRELRDTVPTNPQEAAEWFRYVGAGMFALPHMGRNTTVPRVERFCDHLFKPRRIKQPNAHIQVWAFRSNSWQCGSGNVEHIFAFRAGTGIVGYMTVPYGGCPVGATRINVRPVEDSNFGGGEMDMPDWELHQTYDSTISHFADLMAGWFPED